MNPAGCEWSGKPSDFPTMPVAEGRCWQTLRVDLVWVDLEAEVAEGGIQSEA